jgi:hypothetical protein
MTKIVKCILEVVSNGQTIVGIFFILLIQTPFCF